MEMILLNSTLVNWKNCFSHPAEFVKLDQLVKMKQQVLDKYIGGRYNQWEELICQEIESHKKMLYNLRNIIYIVGTEYFGFEILSEQDRNELIYSYIPDPDLKEKKSNENPILRDFHCRQFWTFLAVRADKLSSEKFFSKVLNAFIQDSFLKNYSSHKKIRKRKL